MDRIKLCYRDLDEADPNASKKPPDQIKDCDDSYYYHGDEYDDHDYDDDDADDETRSRVVPVGKQKHPRRCRCLVARLPSSLQCEEACITF
jgi:hypothetical protein